MSFAATFGVIVGALDEARIPHMLAGSLASTFHGEPRATQDIDVVIDPFTPAALDEFVAALDRGRFYVGDHQDALARREAFNVIDTSTGWKVDLIVRRDRPYSRTEFDRRQPAEVEGIQTFVATAEDTILTKLEWAELGGSERQLRDVEAMVRAVGDALDREYLVEWATDLGVVAELQRCLERSRDG